jgi:hypothetical protein
MYYTICLFALPVWTGHLSRFRIFLNDACPRPDDVCQPNGVIADSVRPRPVGTRGGCGDGRGPCACPADTAIRRGSVRHDGRTSTRTSTRPPHPLHPAPCPYRTKGTQASPSGPHSFVTIHQDGGGHGLSFPASGGKVHQETTLFPFITPFGCQNSSELGGYFIKQA